MTKNTTQQPAAEIIGYKLIERIGAGGFGEVWSAEAPGGLKKALKIVYGYHDEKRAQAELKALDRVKSLRHPFLLSLERIEIFEGQLIVVTELADSSLADLFNQYIDSGAAGIPRDEMLGYMSNSAEALDFLSEEKSLQHLDIKPENLLLVGKHAKVADFGLMKDLKAASQSLMQGMTPAYAAPELFDGQPAPSSDQYSLAIMYCEMISGVRPFPGTTPAQLAAQHVHGKPNLRPIPRGDQAAVSRALSKNPSVRYPSCMAFVEDLKKQRRAVRVSKRRTETGPLKKVKTQVLSGHHAEVRSDVTEMASDNGLPFQPNGMVSVDPPTCDGSKSKIHPTLIITIGDTANRVGQKFKEKLLMRTGGNTEKVPSIRSVFIDSDRKALADLEAITRGTVRNSETIEVPLKKPEDYRTQADAHFGWLSRRWIYNIPRTLQTEGLRPLGRLALADHFSNVCEQLEKVIAEFALSENLAKTADELNLDPGTPDQPRVYIVSSISGGLGSGMTLDLAYTVKLLLAEKGLHDDGVTGILLHSTYQRTRDPGLSAANAFAFLTELRHFNEYGYPGDENLGIPDFPDEAPFQQVYYTELGDDLNRSEFHSSLDKVAEYLSLSIATPCNDFFESCRESETEMEHFALRTFGVAIAGAGDSKQRSFLVESLCHKLIQRWGGVGEDPATLARNLLENLDVNLATIQYKVQQSFSQSRSLDETQVLRQVESQFQAQEDLNSVFNSIYGEQDFDKRDIHAEPTAISQAMEDFLAQDPLTGQSAISKSCYESLCGEDLNLASIEGMASNLAKQFGVWLEQVEAENKLTKERIQSLHAGIETLPRAYEKGFNAETTHAHLSQLCTEKEREFTGRYDAQFIRVMINELLPVHTFATQLKDALHLVDSEFTHIDPELDQASDMVFDLKKLMFERIESQLDTMVKTVADEVYRSVIEPQGGFYRALLDYSTQKYRLPEEMRKAAQQAIYNANELLSIEAMLRENSVAPEQLVNWLNGFINQAKPLVNDCGGRMSMLVATPIRSEENRLPTLIESKHHLKNAAISGTNGKITICFEADDLSLASVAFRLLSKRPDAVELVKRIHTRSDIDWTSLNDLL